MSQVKTLGQRIFAARVAQGKCTMAEFGSRVASMEGRERPYSAAAVAEWESGRSEPRLSTLDAIAKVSGLNHSWLAFGRGTIAHAA